MILKNFLVVIVLRKHLIPFRTQQLSSKTPMVLRGQLRGRVGRRQVYEGLVTLLRGLHPFRPPSFRRGDRPSHAWEASLSPSWLARHTRHPVAKSDRCQALNTLSVLIHVHPWPKSVALALQQCTTSPGLSRPRSPNQQKACERPLSIR